MIQPDNHKDKNMAAASTHHGHDHNRVGRHQGAKVAGVLILLFLASGAGHILFAREVLYDWTQNHRNDTDIPQVDPGSGTPARP